MTARHGARAALALGLVASLAGNVIAAHPTALGRLVAAWPPLALLVAIELVTRIPARGGALSGLRLGSAGLLAAIAAWVSYWHLVELARAAGEGGIAAHLLPLSVDGLVAVASICLREIGQPAETKPTPRPASDRVRSTAALPSAAATAEAEAIRAEPVRRARTSAVTDQGGVGERVRRLAVEHPEWTQAELAAAAGCSDRTVRRHLAVAVPAAAAERSFDDEWAELATLVDPAPAPAAEADLDSDPNPVAVSQEPTR